MNRSNRQAVPSLAVLVMTCFSGCAESGEVTEETANAAEITEMAAETTEIKTETEISKTEITEMTETEAEEEAFPKLLKPSMQGFDHRAADYVTALVDDHDFTGLCQNCVGAMVADINGDSVPEVFLEIPETMCSMTEVFTVRDGKTVCLKAAPDSYTPSGYGVSHGSYDGCLPEIYVGDGKKVILAKYHSGGSVAGSSGIMEISLDGENISAKELCGDSYSKSNFDVFYSYRFGGEEVTEDDYQILRDNYMSELDYCADYSVTLTREILESGCGRPLDLLAKAVDSFYRSYDMADGLEFGVELKPVYFSDSSSIADCHVIMYDGMGNVSSNSYSYSKDTKNPKFHTTSFKYDYSGGAVTKITRCTDSYDSEYIVDEAFDWSIDYYGSIQETRSNVPYADMDESLYKAVTDEHGRVLEETFFASERLADLHSYEDVKVGDVAERIFYRYDSFGNRIYEELDTTIYAPNDAIQDHVKTWEYDSDNRLVKDVFSYWGHDVINEYVYNDNGDMVKRIHTFTGGDDDLNGGREGVYVTDYSYEKDLKGGITRSHSRGSGYYDDDIIEDIYYAPVRVVK
ncbi:MAG: hypothetical protein K2N60_01975 [Oscillospiraceae bacterium]|nr:hypothetical protein [Oscillospiraceae bacterium]